MRKEAGDQVSEVCLSGPQIALSVHKGRQVTVASAEAAVNERIGSRSNGMTTEEAL